MLTNVVRSWTWQKKKNAFDIVKTCCDKYEATPKEELAEYIQELENNKQAVVKHVTPKLKVMDIFQTMQKVREAVSMHVAIYQLNILTLTPSSSQVASYVQGSDWLSWAHGPALISTRS
jgi:hypothetical protein